MLNKFDAYNDSDGKNGWNPRASRNDKVKYFEAVTNDTNTPFGSILSGGAKLNQKNFLNNFNTQSGNYLANNPGVSRTAPTNKSIAKAVRKEVLLRDLEEEVDEDDDPDSESVSGLGGSEEFITSTVLTEEANVEDIDDDSFRIPVVQVLYQIGHVINSTTVTNEKISINLTPPSGWVPTNESGRTFIRFADDGKSISLSFSPVDCLSNPENSWEILAGSSSLSGIYGDLSSGVAHPAVTALQNQVEKQWGDCKRHEVKISLLKKCSGISSIDGLEGVSNVPRQLLYRDSSNGIIGVLHIDLDVDEDTPRPLAGRHLVRSRANKDQGQQYQPSNQGHRYNGRSNGSNRENNENSGSTVNGGSRSWSRRSSKSVSPLRTRSLTNAMPRNSTRAAHSSLSPIRTSPSSSENIWQTEVVGDEYEGDESSKHRSRMQDNATAGSFEMGEMMGALNGIDVTKTDSNVEERLSALEKDVGRIMDVLSICRNDDGSTSSITLDFIERKMNRIDTDVSAGLSVADMHRHQLHSDLKKSVEQVKGTIRNLQEKLDEQIGMKADLVDLAEKVQRTDGREHDWPRTLDELKNGMNDNKSSLSVLQKQFSDERKILEDKINLLGEKGQGALDDLEGIKEKQEKFETSINDRLSNTFGLYDQIKSSYGNRFQPQVTPVKDYC
jgi:hypothetical protein